MTNKALIEILDCFNPEDEVCVEIYDVDIGTLLDTTYDISFGMNEFKQLVLKVNAGRKQRNEHNKLYNP